MSFSTGTTAVEQIDRETDSSKLPPKNDVPPYQLVDTGSTLPTHVLPLRDHTEPPAFGTHPVHNQRLALRTNDTATTHGHTSTWLSYVKEYAPVVGVIGTIIGVIVAIITVAVK